MGRFYINKVSTAYPYNALPATSQRRPYAFVTGTTIQNNRGSVLGGGTTTRTDFLLQKITTRLSDKVLANNTVINSDESGSKRITGTAVGALSHKFTQTTTKRLNVRSRATSHISDSPIAGGGWDYRSYQKLQRFTSTTLGSEVLSNPTFASNLTGWNTSSAAYSASYGGSAKLTDAALISPTAGITLTQNTVYQLEIVVAASARPVIVQVGNSVADTEGTNKFTYTIPAGATGTYKFIMEWTEATDASSYFTISQTETGDNYIGNCSWKVVSAQDTNTTFGTPNDKARFKSGANAAVVMDYVGV